MTTSEFSRLRRSLVAVEQPTASIPDGGCYVYGAGGFGRRVARELVRLGLRVIGFIDITARERASVDGLPCIHPDDLGDVGEAAYVHGLMNHYGPSRDVADWAAGRGFRALVFPADLYAISGFAIENYWLAPVDLVTANLDALEAFHDALDDDESRILLRDLVAYRASTDPRRHPDTVVTAPYAPDFLPILKRPFTFVDGGAYTGDTLVALRAQNIPVSDWIAFEPDGRNMEALRATALRHRAELGSYTLIKAGLSKVNGVVRFEHDAGDVSRIVGLDETNVDDRPWIDVEVVRLDDAVSRSGEVYIKLDIEGAEVDALEGMSGFLGRRPTLAVSVYHRPADLWDIPRIVGSLYDRPRFRLRQHAYHAFDTVLYVMPG